MWLIRGLCTTFSFTTDLLAFRAEAFNVIIQSIDHVIDQGFVYHNLLHDQFISFQGKDIHCHHSKYGLSEHVIDQGFVYHIILHGRFINFQSRGIQCHYSEYELLEHVIDQGLVYRILLYG